MSERRAVVTGGAGFLGCRLVARLLNDGWHVTALDNLSKGTRRRIEVFGDQERFRLVEADIVGDDVTRILRAASAEIVYHLAAHHFIPYCSAHPSETLRLNVVGTQRVIDAVVADPVCRRMIFVSTGDVYAPSPDPHAESSAKRAAGIYGLSKIVGEQLLELAQRTRPDARFVVARLFNLYGPGETNPHVIPDILDAAARGPVLRLGNLDVVRDYVYVDDAADALSRMGAYDGPESVFNVGTGRGHSVRDLVELVGRVMRTPLTAETDPAKLRPFDRPALVADIARVTREIRWQPRTTIEEGIARMLAARPGR